MFVEQNRIKIELHRTLVWFQLKIFINLKFCLQIQNEFEMKGIFLEIDIHKPKFC